VDQVSLSWPCIPLVDGEERTRAGAAPSGEGMSSSFLQRVQTSWVHVAHLFWRAYVMGPWSLQMWHCQRVGSGACVAGGWAGA
jgi:hypothetical protein